MESTPIFNKKETRQETLAVRVVHNGITFEKKNSGWINIEKPDYVIPIETPMGKILENLHRSQTGEKLGEVTYNDMVFERKESGWINIEKPDYVIPITTPIGQTLEKLKNFQ